MSLAEAPTPGAATVLAEVFLVFQDERSNKGYVSQIVHGDGNYQHVTRWGAVGKSFQTKATEWELKESVEVQHQKVIKEKVGKGYRECEPELLGFERGEATQSVVVAIPDVQWTPMLFETLFWKKAEPLLNNDAYFAQRKMDGERRRLRLEAEVVTGFNRKGLPVPVPAVLRLGLQQLAHTPDETIDLDGEVLGNNSFHAFDWIVEPNLPARYRLGVLANRLGRSMILGIHLVPAAETTVEKVALYQRAVDEGWEGLVFKRKDVPYYRGRSAADFKSKLWNEVTVLLTGIVEGKKREIGAFEMTLMTPDGPRRVGNVGIGFKQDDLANIATMVRAGRFLAADVRYLYYDQAALFQPCFRRIRGDLTEGELASQKIYGRDGVEIAL